MASAPLIPRHYVIMEVKQNLVAGDRQKNLERFNLPHFRKVACVVMGEPPAVFKQRAQEKILKDKQEKSDITWKQQQNEKKRKRDMEKAQKEREAVDAKRKAELAKNSRK